MREPGRRYTEGNKPIPSQIPGDRTCAGHLDESEPRKQESGRVVARAGGGGGELLTGQSRSVTQGDKFRTRCGREHAVSSADLCTEALLRR